MSSEKLDLRVLRTQMMIAQAFNNLLNEKGFQAITVQEIADRAMINRATFYDHFADKYALFEHTMRETFRETLTRNMPADFDYCISNIEFLVTTLCEFVAKIESQCRHTNTQGMPPFNEQVTGLLSEALSGWFDETDEQAHSLAATVEVASWAMFGAARHWSHKPHDIALEEYARQVAPTIEAILHRLEPLAAA